MSYYLAPSLFALRAEINSRWPSRSKRSDGWIGDAAHSARTSDHNPNSRRSVNAIDVTAAGIDTAELIRVAIADSRVNYVIFNRLIYSRVRNFRAVAYTRSNPHTTHVHVSIRQARDAEQNQASWGIAGSTTTTPVSTWTKVNYGETLQLGTHGDPVVEWQEKALGYTGSAKDGYFGSGTEADTRSKQTAHGVTVDGRVGPETWPLRLLPTPVAVPAPTSWREVTYGNPLSIGTHGRPVVEWQEKGLGYTGSKADGYFGSGTDLDTKRKQVNAGLKPTGVVDTATWALRLT